MYSAGMIIRLIAAARSAYAQTHLQVKADDPGFRRQVDIPNRPGVLVDGDHDPKDRRRGAKDPRRGTRLSGHRSHTSFSLA
jgi:hypothetical protein